MEKADVVIIGAGVIGLAIAHTIGSRNKNIIVLEQYDSFGRETSSRNSEVIHAGLHYPKDSLKTQTCIRGKHLLYEICVKNSIPHNKTGKLIVACNDAEAGKLEEIYKNALECGVRTLQKLTKNDIKRKEPDIKAKMGLFSQDTGIIDSHSFMSFLFNTARQKGADFAFNVKVIGIRRGQGCYELTVKEPQGDLFDFKTDVVINAAGLYSDKMAEFAGLDIDAHHYRLHYCKGQYFRIRNPRKFTIRHSVYPPPTATDLGIHITPDLSNGLRLGPNAEYVEEIDYNMDEISLKTFYTSTKRFLPSLDQSDLIPDTSGIRPKLQGKDDLFRDFVVSDETDKGLPGFIDLIGLESPGLTASLAIAEIVGYLLR